MTLGDQRKKAAIGDRLFPALLDRLVQPTSSMTTESDPRRAMSRSEYRQCVLRDLRWLFNAINSASEVDYTGFEHAERSVMNFGLPALAGQRLSELDWPKIENFVRDALLRFEPRLLPETVQVRAVKSSSSEAEYDPLAQHNVVAFEIKAQLWSEPYPLELLLRSKIDLESGVVTVQDNSVSAA